MRRASSFEDDKGKEKLVEDNGKGKAKQIDDHDDDDLDTLDLENIIKKLEEDLAELKANEAKEAREAELKAKEAKKAKDTELKAKKAKEAMLAELKAKKAKRAKNAKEAMLAEVVASNAPIGYRKITMTGCVIALFAPNALNAPPPSATRKRKST
ncbi:hypothetical protein Tco_0637467 [Tanacetum coccineum]